MTRARIRGAGRVPGQSSGCPIARLRNTSARRTPSRRSFGEGVVNGPPKEIIMKIIIRRVVIAAALVCGLMRPAAIPVVAHHSFDAEYDSKKPFTVTGFVTKLDWINPHAFVYIDVKSESGEVKNYRIEMGPPYALVRGGWKRDTIKVGDKVTVVGAAASKDGRDAGGSMPTTAMMLPDG